MNNTTIIFSDEAGQYYKKPNEKQIISDPFYVRSAVYLTTEEYIAFQKDIITLKKKYNLPINEEVKWSDIYELQKKRYRVDFLKDYSIDKLKQYITDYISIAHLKQSIKYVFTISGNRYQNTADKEYIIFAHLQNIYQRAQFDATDESNDFYMVIIDDMNETALNNLRQRCCDLLHNGDRFVDYSNLNQSLLVEKSEQSAGIQIADYAAGVFNSVAKKYILEKNPYDYANRLYSMYIAPKIRRKNKKILGYGIMKITKNMTISNLNALIEATESYL